MLIIRPIRGLPVERATGRLLAAIDASDSHRHALAARGARLARALAGTLAHEAGDDAETRAVTQHGVADDLFARAQELATAWFPVGDRGWVHGRVVDARRRGLPGLRVAAFDRAGAVVADSRTDGHGYFRLELLAPAGTSGDPATGGRIIGGGRVFDGRVDERVVDGRLFGAALRVFRGEEELARLPGMHRFEPGTVGWREIELTR